MFEYKILTADGLVPVEELNVLGADGWEISTILQNENQLIYIFKRYLRPHQNVLQHIWSKPKLLAAPDMTQISKVFDDE